ncbi:MAG TPA: DUF362 domain-containing protein, partial [Pirellulaceae bacterium]
LGAAAATCYTWSRFRPPREPVFIAKHQRYDRDLTSAIREGLAAVGFSPSAFQGKSVLLKPNLVEPARDRPQMTTHPAVVMAAAEYFLSAGATVAVGEAPGHVRDTGWALAESGLGPALRELKLRFADLNYESVRWFPNQGGCSKLRGIYFPQSVAEADWVVSMPKLKTHHWVGVTASMKNLYGVLPGIKYGWPKNVLHHAGIPETVVDIGATLPRTLAIVDAVDCMEGDGPILGSLKHMGLLLVGRSLPAVDATAARIMGLVPERVSYLRLAAERDEAVAERHIEQRGEPWRDVARDFTILDVPHLRQLQANLQSPLVSAIDLPLWEM